MPGTTLGRGNLLYDWLIAPTLTPVSVAGSTAAEQSFTIQGLQVGDVCDINCQSAQTAGIGIGNVRVPSANTLTVEFTNSTAGALTPTSGVYNINIQRPEGGTVQTTAV